MAPTFVAQTARQLPSPEVADREEAAEDGSRSLRRISQQFKPLVEHRLLSVTEAHKERETKERFHENKFEPAINKRSEKIAMKCVEKEGVVSYRNQSCKASTHSLSRPSQMRNWPLRNRSGSYNSVIQRAKVASALGHRRSTDSRSRLVYSSVRGHRDPSSRPPLIKFEDFLIAKGQKTKEKQQQLAKNKEKEPDEDCTFSPRINKQSLSRLKKRTKSAMEASDARNGQSSANVFYNLYEMSRLKAERSISSQRIAQQYQMSKELGNCTFKPDFSKTHEISRKYLLRKKEAEKDSRSKVVLKNMNKINDPTKVKANKKMLRQFVNCHKKEHFQSNKENSKQNVNLKISKVELRGNSKKMEVSTRQLEQKSHIDNLNRLMAISEVSQLTSNLVFSKSGKSVPTPNAQEELNSKNNSSLQTSLAPPKNLLEQDKIHIALASSSLAQSEPDHQQREDEALMEGAFKGDEKPIPMRFDSENTRMSQVELATSSIRIPIAEMTRDGLQNHSDIKLVPIEFTAPTTPADTKDMLGQFTSAGGTTPSIERIGIEPHPYAGRQRADSGYEDPTTTSDFVRLHMQHAIMTESHQGKTSKMREEDDTGSSNKITTVQQYSNNSLEVVLDVQNQQ